MSLKPVVHTSFQEKSLLQNTLHGTNAKTINSGQRNISPHDTNAYSWLLHIRSLFFQI